MKIIKIPAIGVLALIMGMGCGHPARNAEGEAIADSSIEHGRALAATYCGSCHLLPDPDLLNKVSWEKGVLPAMGPRLGIFEFGHRHYPSYAFDPNVGFGFYPSKPLLTDWQWKEVIDYYSGLAPDSMPPQPEHEAIANGPAIFQAVAPPAGRKNPVTCYVHVDTSGGRRQIVTAGMFPGTIMRYDAQLRQLDSTPVTGGIVDVQYMGDSMIACNIGNINPNNLKLGSLSVLRYDRTGHLRQDSLPFIRDLARPVQVTAADLNGDHLTDYLVCEFGHQKGALSWYENKGNGGFERHVLRAEPGAIRAYVRDANGDGLPDIWVLFAQGDEGIFLFINKGNGRFEEQRILRFPPIYGSSYFELADFNKDGFPDIVYTCGDNGDYSPVFKPYHGVYIFMNDGQNHFTQSFFYPINGCYKAIARDFDGDGDLDLATMAYFADYGNHPEEGFVYLQNEGGMQFKPYSLPATQVGRWLTMDAGDLDGAGKPDILLGNFSMGPSLSRGKQNWKIGPPFLLLRNEIGSQLPHN
jgi:FG-GAP-like repeat